MSTTRASDSPAPDAVATALREAEFVRLYARPTGAALAATGVLARALRAAGTPFHVRTTRDGAVPEGDGTALGVGWVAPDELSVSAGDRPVPVVAAEVVEELGIDPDPIVVLAGVSAAGSAPGTAGSGSLLEAAERRGAVERRPGLAVPTADPANGLANSTLLRTPYSGDSEAARALLAEIDYPADPDDDARRRLASVVALDATTDAPPRAAETVAQAVHPFATPDGPFATLGGYADVLAAVAREAPGLGVALALGNDVARDAALDTWRSHAETVHRLITEGTTARYDGVFVVRTDDGPEAASTLTTAAKMAYGFRSPEPVALVAADGAAAAAGTGELDVTATLDAAVDDGSACGDVSHGDVRFDGNSEDVIEAFREAV